MSFKLSFGEPKYFVNEEKKIVTCVMDYRLKFPGDDWRMVNALKYISDCYIEDKDNMIRYEFQVDAQAKLDPQDEFDVEVGKKVARAKAESRAYQYVIKQMGQAYSKFVENLVRMEDEFFKKADSVIEHNNRYLSQF